MLQRIRLTRIVAAFAVLCVALSSRAAQADSLTIAWDPNPESSVAGYFVYIGTSSGDRSTAINAGKTTRYTFTSASPGTMYFVTVAAYFPGPVIGPAAPELVTSINGAPVLVHPGSQSGKVGVAASLAISVSDPNGEAVSLQALGLPPGLMLSGSTRTISGTPTAAGSYPVSLTATDASGHLATLSFPWTIESNDVSAPVVTITSPTSSSSYSTTEAFITLSGTAVDDVGVTSVNWHNSAGGSGLAAGNAAWSVVVPLTAGSNVISISARDAAGKTGTSHLTVSYTVAAPAPAPSPAPEPQPSPAPSPAPEPIPEQQTDRLRLASLVADKAPPQQVGTSIAFKAAATGGTGKYQFQWMVYDGRQWTVALKWGKSSSFNWKPSTASDAYRVEVWVRDAGSKVTAPDSPDAAATMAFPISAKAPSEKAPKPRR